jgi:lipid A 3-O-deacylase
MRCRGRIGIFMVGGLAALAVAAAHAAEPETAWTAAGAPLEATGSFVPPPPGTDDAVRAPLDSRALYDDDFRRGGILSEVRLGVLAFWQSNASTEQGAYVTGQVLFDPFVPRFDNWFLNVFLRPRPHIGGTASPWGTDQLFAGLTWNAPFGRIFFAEASFGGTIHDGPLTNAQVALGCRVLFRESLGLGANIGEHWRVIAGVDHSSHAELCGQNNDGLTHIGASVGYRF